MNFLNKLKQSSAIPGFSITIGFTIIYLLLIVILPLSSLFIIAGSDGFDNFIKAIFDDRVVSAYKISFGASLVAALINVIFGTILSWVLVRYDFWGKKLLDAIIDLPFALPTAVAGIALATIYSHDGIIGSYFAGHDIKIAFTPIGIIIALVFVGLPFVVRTVQPVLQDMDKEIEEAAIMLGANHFQIAFKIIIPYLIPALLTGFSMSFARALSEYGSVIFIAGNIPFMSEIIPLIIVTKLEQYDYEGAAAVALVMLFVSFILLLLINYLQKLIHKK